MVQPSADQQLHASARCTDPALLSRAGEVGKEFVYIYYMSVNKCPQDLYRFYSASSLYIHGGRERPGQELAPASGQAAIAARIASLKLNDCRTKILMVDAVPDSTGEGVLIQVCGEISNDAGPMRRFMQTFLLSPIGPKKYFVQRDIFRYQDEVFTDVDSTADAAAADEGSETSGDQLGAGSASPTPPPPPPQLLPIPQPALAGVTAATFEEPPGLISAAATNGEASSAGAVQAEEALQSTAEAEPAAHEADEPDDSAAAAATAASTVPKEVYQVPPPIVSSSGGGAASAAAAPAAPGVKKNFAALFGGGSSALVQPLPLQPARRPVPPPTATATTTNGSGEQHLHAAEQQQHQAPHSADQDVPDNQQLFVGNIRSDMTEDELAAVFAKFGQVVACRIANGRGKSAGAGHNRNLASFGFVSFASAKSVRTLVDMKQLDLGNGEHLNLDEKKSTGGPRRPQGGGGGGGSGGRGGMRRGGDAPRR